MPERDGPPRSGQDRLRPVVGWVLFDFANTIFSFVVLTMYFPRFLNERTGGNEAFGWVASLSTALAGVLTPVAGALSDRTRRYKTHLVPLVLVCCAATAAMAAPVATGWILILFVLANLTYQVSFVQYNALLPFVASPGRVNRVNGLGVALGYAGVFFAYLIGGVVVARFGRAAVFPLGAALFVVFSLPIFAWVADPVVPAPPGRALEAVRRSIASVWATARSLLRQPRLLGFFGGNFLCVDALNTMIFFVAVYLEKRMGLGERQVGITMMLLTTSAAVWGLLWGVLLRPLGAFASYAIAAAGLLVLTLLLAVGPGAGAQAAIVALGGMGTAGLWVAGRRLLLEVAPPGQIGEYAGFYSLTTHISSLGAILFGLLSDWDRSYRAAMLSLAVALALGIGLLTLMRRKEKGSGPFC